MCEMVTWLVLQLLFYQTGVEVSGAPRQNEVASFVSFTNILGRPCWAAGRAGGETEWRGHANNIYAPPLPLCFVAGRGDIVLPPVLCFSTLVSLKPDTSNCVICWNLLTTVWSLPGCRCFEATERGASRVTTQQV